jgi:hypothetical protein
MFASKPGDYLSEASFRLSPIGSKVWPYPQTLDKAGKACQGQTLVNNGHKMFYNIGPGLIYLVKVKYAVQKLQIGQTH